MKNISRLEMGGLAILLAVLSFIFMVIVVGMNMVNCLQPKVSEGLKVEKSSIEVKIRKVLDSMTSDGLCPLYATLRAGAAKNEKAGQDITDQEANKRVEAGLALKIPGGALPCPLLTYPKPGSSDLDWLDFLQRVPSDFGARVVLMAIYAKGFLTDKEQMLKDALSGKGEVPVSDGFTVCTPDLATSRRAEKKPVQPCTLPEDLSPQDIDDAVTKLLKELVAQKNTILKEKKIDPTVNIEELIKTATVSAKYIKEKSEQAKDGTLQMDGPIPGK